MISTPTRSSDWGRRIVTNDYTEWEISNIEQRVKKLRGLMKIAKSIDRKMRYGRELDRLQIRKAVLVLSR